MPDVITCVARVQALEYDGANGQDLADLVSANFTFLPWAVTAADGASVTLTCDAESFSGQIVVPTGHFVVSDSASPYPQPVSPAELTHRFITL